MDLQTKPGDQVIFKHPDRGWPSDIKDASEFLKVDEKYTVESINVGGFTSYVRLKESPGISFNTCMFENI